jgi:hypothetical protein
MKREGLRKELDEAERLKGTPFAENVLMFWSPDSAYLIDKADNGKPLSNEYVDIRKRYTERFVVDYPSFKKTPLRSVSLFQIERYMRYLREHKMNGNTVSYFLRFLQAPLSWAKGRGFLDTPFDFYGISRPKETYQERGILTTEELMAVVACRRRWYCLDAVFGGQS